MDLTCYMKVTSIESEWESVESPAAELDRQMREEADGDQGLLYSNRKTSCNTIRRAAYIFISRGDGATEPVLLTKSFV
ncbi:hypothetical protein Pmani_008061 [Petrolisthes manimaculis]|uniref:Uncharacterized protein n=1 Tax=Petrolisthes manimaculis TaxID=1843537 RepID=A0AAE1Q7J2_9EUCA|nr:hypothetical protein Pmani_008061 [Petrolisthes manimaculis]